MLSALLMLRRVSRALRYAVREEDFVPVLTAGVLLVVIGTTAYALQLVGSGSSSRSCAGSGSRSW